MAMLSSKVGSRRNKQGSHAAEPVNSNSALHVASIRPMRLSMYFDLSAINPLLHKFIILLLLTEIA